MDEKDFKKHLRDLVHGHHHPEEHDWSQTGAGAKRAPAKTVKRRAATKRTKRSK